MANRRLWFTIVLLIGVSGVVTFAWLGSVPLLDPDEPVYAETAREMLAYQDFISPRIYGEFWYDKPPMYYWLVAAAFKVFGIGEFAARFPSALLATAGAVVVYLSGRKLFNERAGMLAGLILATSLEYFYLGKAAVTDVTLTFFLTTAFLAFLDNRYYLFYACAALAVVTKGPVGIIFCVAIIGLYIAVTSQWRLLKEMKLLSGTLVFLVIALPWYLVMYQYHGMPFIETFLGFHNITRFTQPEHLEGNIWYYYIPVIIFGFFPWTAFMVQAFRAALKAAGANRNSLIFLVIWVVTVFGFFTVSQTKLVSYILPMYPALALLTGWYFDRVWSANRAGVLVRAAVILTVIAGSLAAGLMYTGKTVAAGLYIPGIIMAVVLAAAIVLVWWLSARRDFRSVFAANVLVMMLFSNFLMAQLLPVIAPIFSTKAFVAEFNAHYDGQSQVYVAKFYRPGFMFYSGIPGKELAKDELTAIILRQEQTAFFIIKNSDYNGLAPAVRDKVSVLATQEDKVLVIKQSDK